MINGKKVLAIIPARAGSKRLPGKNTKILGGKPMIQWTIEAARHCVMIDEVIVSTDDLVIADLAEKLGATVPFIRPTGIAQDCSSSLDVVMHAFDFYSENGCFYDYVMLLQPTSPLRTSKHLQGAIDLLMTKSADAVISVCETEHSPLWANTIDDSCNMDSFLDQEVIGKRSQDLAKYYRLNGAIYLVNSVRLKEERSFFLSSNIYAYKMDRKSSVDVDESIDFLLAESIFNSENTHA